MYVKRYARTIHELFLTSPRFEEIVRSDVDTIAVSRLEKKRPPKTLKNHEQLECTRGEQTYAVINRTSFRPPLFIRTFDIAGRTTMCIERASAYNKGVNCHVNKVKRVPDAKEHSSYFPWRVIADRAYLN